MPELGGCIFSGFAGTATGLNEVRDTWLWDGTSISLLHPGSSAPGAFMLSKIGDGQVTGMTAYDPQRQRIVEMGNPSQLRSTQLTHDHDPVQIFDRDQLRFEPWDAVRGQHITLEYHDPAQAGRAVLFVFGLDNTGLLPVKPSPYDPDFAISIPLSPTDPLFLASLANPIIDFIDATGSASLPIQLPNTAGVEWLKIHACAVTFGVGGIRDVSNPAVVQVLPQ
jgi:hypothetical protein